MKTKSEHDKGRRLVIKTIKHNKAIDIDMAQQRHSIEILLSGYIAWDENKMWTRPWHKRRTKNVENYASLLVVFEKLERNSCHALVVNSPSLLSAWRSIGGYISLQWYNWKKSSLGSVQDLPLVDHVQHPKRDILEQEQSNHTNNASFHDLWERLAGVVRLCHGNNAFSLVFSECLVDSIGVGVSWEGVDDVGECYGVVHRGDCSCNDGGKNKINNEHEFSCPIGKYGLERYKLCFFLEENEKSSFVFLPWPPDGFSLWQAIVSHENTELIRKQNVKKPVTALTLQWP